MGKTKLIELIDQTEEIKQKFETRYRTTATYMDRAARRVPYKTIRQNSDFLFWKGQIEYELELLQPSKLVSDLTGLLAGIVKTNSYNEDIYFAHIEAKLKVLKELLINLKETEEEGKMEKTHKLFISHSNKDADYVEVFVGLLEILGLRDEEIICSSIPPYCIPLGNKVYEWLINEFQHSDLHVVYILSKDYYSSAASLNEMGAAWAMKHKWTGILLPGFQFSQLDGCIDKTQISIKLDDADDRTLKYRLSELKDELTKEFNLRPMSEAAWERQRDSFLDKITAITEKRTGKAESSKKDDRQHIPMVGQDDVGNIPVETAFLLVYAAEGNGQIFRLATLNSAVQVSADGKQFMANNSQRESAKWQEALDMLVKWGWVKPVGRKGEIYEVTGTGYTKADWLKDGMQIDTSIEPLEELKHFEV